MVPSSPEVLRRSPEVLLVEDNPGDVNLVIEALKESDVNVHCNVVEDGEQAIRYLRRDPAYSQAAKPDLILLDLNIPKKSGLDVLREIKKDTQLSLIPVVVLTTSRTDKDILKSYGLGANCFITKPIGFYEFMKAIQSIVSTLLKNVQSGGSAAQNS